MGAKIKNPKNPSASNKTQPPPKKEIPILNFQALKFPESIKGYIVNRFTDTRLIRTRQFALSPGKMPCLHFFSKFNTIHSTSNQSRDSSVDIINSKRQVKGKFSHVVQIDVRRLLYCYTLNPFLIISKMQSAGQRRMASLTPVTFTRTCLGFFATFIC